MRRLAKLTTITTIAINATLSIALVLPLTPLGLMPATPALAAEAPKSATNGSDFNPGEYVNLEIAITKPTIPANTSLTPVEIMVAVDLSGSIHSEISQVRSHLSTFANNLSSYLGKVRVGIYKFGSGSGGFSAKTIATQADLNQLTTAISNLEAAQSGVGTSDILGGLRDANNGFTNNSTKKFLVLITDGYANHPFSDGGRCPINITSNWLSRTTAVNLKSTSFGIVHVASGQYTMKLSDGSTGFDPCGGTQWSGGARSQNAYVDWRYDKHISNQYCLVGENSSQGTPACELLREMESVYPNTSRISSINPTLNAVIAEADNLSRVASMSISEQLNSNIFDATAGISQISVVRCGTSTAIGSASLAPGSNLRLTGTITITNHSETNYCLRFRARVKSSPTFGNDQSINTTGNTVIHRNAAGTALQTDTIGLGSIDIIEPYTAPTNLAYSNLTCNSVTLQWSAGSPNITRYDVNLTPNTGSQNPRNAGTSTSLTINNLAESTSYSWTLTPHTASGARTAITAPSSARFTTPACRSLGTSIRSGTIVRPGNSSSAVMTVDLNYIPNASAWGSEQFILGLVAILPGNSSCSAYTATSPVRTSGQQSQTSGITGSWQTNPAPGNLQGQTTITAPTNLATLNLWTNSDTLQGVYTACISTRKANSSTTGNILNPIASQTFEIRYAKWLQINSSELSRSTGDVHSNGSIIMNIPPNKFFLFDGLSGVISSSAGGSNSVSITSNRLSSIINWRVPNLQPAIATPNFARLLEVAQDNHGGDLPTLTATEAASGRNHILARCNANSSAAFLVTGNLTRSGINTTLNQTNCSNANLIYFIDGNLTIDTNIIDDTHQSTLTYIVKGDIIVNRSVRQMDGFYVFGGNFRNNGGSGNLSNPLTIRGSLIGLAGSSPNSSNGGFRTGTQSGFLRDLDTSNQNPAETIIYQPKYLMRLTPLLGGNDLTWTEM